MLTFGLAQRQRSPRAIACVALLTAAATMAVADARPIAVQGSMFAESDAYERFMGRWSRLLAPALVRFADVQPGHAVLDVGSGTGALSAAIADAIPTARIVGVDLSKAYVAAAQSRLGSDRMRFVVGDAQQLDFPSASFDRALSMLVINFIPDPAKALREMIRVTRPGGVVAAVVWDYGDGMQMLRVFWDEAVAANPAAEKRDERHMPLCQRGQLAALWSAQGLAKVTEEPLTIPMEFASFDDFWTPFLGGQGPAGVYASSLSEPDRLVLRDRLRKRLLGNRQDGPITLQGRAWAVRGVVD